MSINKRSIVFRNVDRDEISNLFGGKMSLPLVVIFGIEINRKYFGKKPKEDMHPFLGFSPRMRMEIAEGNVEMVNYFGEGSFIPYDVVPMHSHPSDMTLFLNLIVFELNEYLNVKLGDIIKTKSGEFCTVFGYVLPKNWEQLGIKVIDESDNRFTFALTENNQIIDNIMLPPVGLIKD